MIESLNKNKTLILELEYIPFNGSRKNLKLKREDCVADFKCEDIQNENVTFLNKDSKDTKMSTLNIIYIFCMWNVFVFDILIMSND